MMQALFDYWRATRGVAVVLFLLLATLAGPWNSVAAAPAVNRSEHTRLVPTTSAILQANNSNSTCLGSTPTFLTTATVQSDHSDPVLTDNTAVLCLNVALTLGQRVWEDLNGNGLQEAGEPGLVGVTVQLVSATGTLLQSTLSTANGAYSFSGITAGAYQVRVTPPAGYQFTTPNQGSDDTVDSDVDPTTGRTALIVLADATGSRDWGAGLFRPVTIGDLIWEDVNGNGVQEISEPGLAGVTVQLYDSRNTLIASTTTAANGAYKFQGLPPGNYYLLVVPPVTP